jgi:pyruvate dehydrogenase E2 component (dihydrolipoamide acetyltransferase)
MADSTEMLVPDIGDFEDVPVVEVLVAAGDAFKAEDPIVTLESDKATMDVPAPFDGVVGELKVQVGDTVSEGSLLMTVTSGGNGDEPAGPDLAEPAVEEATATKDGSEGEADSPKAPAAASESPAPSASNGSPQTAPDAPPPTEPAASADAGSGGPVHASPSVRRAARELGVDLARIQGSGRKGRILKEDVQSFKDKPPEPGPSTPAPAADGAGLGLAPWPKVNFEKFGPVERKPLSRIQKISGPNLHRNWVMIPHVTHQEEADITELEAFRKEIGEGYKKQGIRITMLAFLIKASVATLKAHPIFNASLDGDDLVLRQYYNIGFAAETPNGLMVPVIKEVDSKGVAVIAQELGDLSGQAREGKLKPADMAGSTFTISSLGGIGGTGFTPIINAPEVAILGVTRSAMKPVWDGSEFKPRLILPLSLSYDHRVIDGAAAARFAKDLATLLTDLRRALL